jgi:ankyrin repeat protein
MYGLEFDVDQDYGSTLLIQVLFEIEADPSLLISDMLEAEDMLDAAASLATREGFALILADPRVDPRMRGSGCLIVAIMSGNIPVLELLLEDGRVDPSEDRNAAIRTAVEEGDTEATRLLLADKRVDASDEHNEAIHTAAKYGFVDIFELLLADKNVQRYGGALVDPFGFEPALLGGHIEIVRLISENQTNHLETIINWGLVLASKIGNVKIVKLLLEHEKIDDTRVDDAIALATKRKHWEIVKLIRSRFPE